MSSMRAAITLDKGGYRAARIHPRSGTFRPHFVPEGTSTMLGIQVVSGPESIAPGETAEVEFEFVYDISYDDLHPGVRFTIVEGPHRVGVGVVVEPRS